MQGLVLFFFCFVFVLFCFFVFSCVFTGNPPPGRDFPKSKKRKKTEKKHSENNILEPAAGAQPGPWEPRIQAQRNRIRLHCRENRELHNQEVAVGE